MKEYVCPQTVAVELKAEAAILNLSSITVSQDENNGGYDAKDFDMSEEDLYEILLGWDKFFD